MSTHFSGKRPAGRRTIDSQEFSLRRSPVGSESWEKPWVQIKYFTYNSCVFASMIGAASPDARPGDIVTVYDRKGEKFGSGLYNPKARIPLRVYRHGTETIDENFFLESLRRAARLRRDVLKLDEVTEAYRVVNSDGDNLSGLMVDRYGDVLLVEVHSLGVFQRIADWIAVLHEELGTRREIVRVDPDVAAIEGIDNTWSNPPKLTSIKIRENGIRYEVNFEAGHKTGFFCDQRDNRHRLTRYVKGKRVLDLCCYTGGFSISAKVKGEADDVTAVDLDERAVEQAKHNGNLNQVRIKWVHADAFTWARQMQRNGERWEVVVLDPPKFMESRRDEAFGRKKYEDLNTLGISLIEQGGILVTCSCSGLLSATDFEALVIKAAHKQGRRLQILERTGAALDHPEMSNCPESRYLKVLWARVF